MVDNKPTVLFVVDYGLDSSNSVAQILRNICYSKEMECFNKVVFVLEQNYYALQKTTINNIVQISTAKEKTRDTFYKRNVFKCLYYKSFEDLTTLAKHGYKYVRTSLTSNDLKIIKRKFNIDYVLYLTFFPDPYALKAKIPYSYFLYDTYLSRPGVKKHEIRMEKKVIDHSIKYYLHSYFFDYYQKTYPSDQHIHSLHYPLFPSKDEVNTAIKSVKKEQYQFSYFGQLQDFRNVPEIASIFKEANLTVDVFSWERPIDSPAFKYHDVANGEEFFKKIAESKFLLVFDNNEPFAHYIPSKLYQLVAFSKPIILFTKNDHSASKKFLENYPHLFVYDLRKNKPSDLLLMINSYKEDKDSLFEQYNKMFSKEEIVDTIKNDFLNHTAKK